MFFPFPLSAVAHAIFRCQPLCGPVRRTKPSAFMRLRTREAAYPSLRCQPRSWSQAAISRVVFDTVAAVRCEQSTQTIVNRIELSNQALYSESRCSYV